jgi:tRNA 2-selenouridine synthase
MINIHQAINLPVLNNEQRARIGTLHKTNSFAARIEGASYISEHISHHLKNHFIHKPKNYRPLIYWYIHKNKKNTLQNVLKRFEM